MAGAKHAGRIVAITTAAAVILAACSSGAKGGAGSGHAGKARSAVTTTDADWKPVADALGRSGKLGDSNTAYRINLPRNDLHITSYGVDIKPGLSLGGYGIRPIRQQRNAADGRPRDHRGGVAQGHRCVAGAWYRPDRTAQASAAARPAGVVDPHSRHG
ncbi:protein of unknown function [Mycobacterium canettii CIPT 140070008]|nr:protein of unknown function [Mycobacterium canettii CIPT 140070008]